MDPSPSDFDVDELFNFAPTRDLDIQAEELKAKQRHRQNALDLAAEPSPPTATGRPDEAGPEKGGKSDKPAKERKKVVRLDEGLLIGDMGIPRLIQDTKHFRIKGKGHEEEDLKRLLHIYQYWSHRMYPKTQFKDTIERVEKLCHSRRLNVKLSVWRDEAHGKTRPDVEEHDLADIPEPAARHSSSEPSSGAAEYASSSSAYPTRPPSSPDDDDDWHLAALNQTKPNGKPTPSSPALSMHMHNDDDASMWDDIEEMSSVPSKPKPNLPMDDDDEEMWDIIRQNEDGQLPPQPAQQKQIVEEEWGDEMYL